MLIKRELERQNPITSWIKADLRDDAGRIHGETLQNCEHKIKAIVCDAEEKRRMRKQKGAWRKIGSIRKVIR